MPRAILYARISGQNDERTASLDSQVEGGAERAAQLGFDLHPEDVHRERFSGLDLDRPELNRVREKVRARTHSCLVVWALDRLSRGGQFDMHVLFDECVRHGVEVVSVTEEIDQTPEGCLIGSIKAYVGQVERAKIRDRTMRGRNDILKRGRLPLSGYARYGYTYDPETGGRQVDPEAAEVVRNVFAWAVEGASARAIARRLNAEHVPTPRERLGHRFKDGRSPRWGDAAVGRMIRDETYLGTTAYGKTRCNGKRARGRPVQEPVDRSEWREMPAGLTPPLVDRASFDKANARLADRADAVVRGRNSLRPRLLRGRISCGVCGLPMHPVTDVFKGKSYHYYACASRDGRKAAGRCGAKMIPADHADEQVWVGLVQLLSEPGEIQAQIEAAARSREGRPARADVEAAESCVRRLAGLQDVLRGKWAAALAAGEAAFAAVCEDQLRRTANDLDAGRATLAAARTRLDRAGDLAKQAAEMRDLFARVRANTRPDMTFEEKRHRMDILDVHVKAKGKTLDVGFLDLELRYSVVPRPLSSTTSHKDRYAVRLRLAV